MQHPSVGASQPSHEWAQPCFERDPDHPNSLLRFIEIELLGFLGCWNDFSIAKEGMEGQLGHKHTDPDTPIQNLRIWCCFEASIAVEERNKGTLGHGTIGSLHNR